MKVAIIMGSASDMPVMEGAINILKGLGLKPMSILFLHIERRAI